MKVIDPEPDTSEMWWEWADSATWFGKDADEKEDET